MGLSVLIPVYNYSVVKLVHSLVQQIDKNNEPAELIILEDGSSKEFQQKNLEILNHPAVRIQINETNEGRMSSRLKLAGHANYEYLLFLDADSEIPHGDFLKKYMEQAAQGKKLVSGGRIYSEIQPDDCGLRLHWKYGTRRESRAMNADSAFMSNNFMVLKEVFGALPAAGKLTGYGHEDSWWGIQFEQMGITCDYIENPVVHGSLERSENFISKSKEALKNLLVLERISDPALLLKSIKIYRWYRKLKKTRLSGPFLFFENLFHNYFRKNLLSCNPSLFYFDCYRLAELIRLSKE